MGVAKEILYTYETGLEARFCYQFQRPQPRQYQKNIDYGHNEILKKQKARMIWPYILLVSQNQTTFQNY